MSEAGIVDTEEDLRASDRKAYFEQRLFVLSPFGTAPTALLLFTLFLGTFAIALAVDDAHPVTRLTDGAIVVGEGPRLAVVLSLLLTTVLAVQRVVRLRQRADIEAFARILRGGPAQAMQFAQLTPPAGGLWYATAIGVLIGLAADYLLYFLRPSMFGLAEQLWFSAITLWLVVTFVRGVELTRAGARGSAAVIDHDLVIDLLRIDDLSVWGRDAARYAIIWFTISAVTCLLFTSRDVTLFSVALLLGCLLMGITVFVSMMERVHRKIRTAKREELSRLRGEIDLQRPAAVADAAAATRLQGLLAYEARIMAAPEWPFDQTTLVRVSASALILTVPWFGQAFAAFVVDRMSHLVG